ncbi:MAG: efflux RND transporter periplasmic adaptor subunit [Candidatus Ornithomonoglobus sp.]
MTKKQFTAAAAAICLLITAAGCGKKNMPEQEIASNATNVTVYEAGTEYIEDSVKYTGELKTSENTSTVSKVSAKIIKVNVKEGDYVHAGDILAELDSTDLQSSYNTALASYNSALASYNSVVNSSTKQATTSAKNSLNSAQLAYNQALENYNREKELYESGSTLKLAEQSYNDALSAYNREKELYDNDTSLISARNNLQTAEDNLANTKSLYEIGAVSKNEYDTAVTNVENLRASLESLESQKQASYENAYSAMVKAQENLSTTRISLSASYDQARNTLNNAENTLAQAKENIGLTEVSNASSISTANAQLESARTALSTAKDNLDNTKIRAMSSGYIASKSAEIGQMASPGVELFAIKNTNTLMAEISVTESVIPLVHQGTKAIVSVQSAGVDGISGVVTLVNPTKDEKTGMYTVQVEVDNGEGKLNTGMFADVTLITDSTMNAVTIPSEAIILSGEESYVYVASADGTTAEKRTVVTGIETEDATEIVTGIEIGDRVIVSGQDYLSEQNNEINIVTE